MNLLFIGDIYGSPGRKTVGKALKKIREEHRIDVVIANAENICHGKGVSKENLEQMRKAGVDFFTSGNHVFKERDIIPFMDNPKLGLIRPANYPASVPGRGYAIVETGLMKKVLVINLMGRIFMPVHLDCPFKAADRILEETKHEKFSAIFVDFHAEATSEKAALAHYLDGRVTAVIGTHTHVPTADASILPKGTAFQSDVGFTGPRDSIIGADKVAIIENFLTQMPVKHEVARGPTVFNAVKIVVDEATCLAEAIETIQSFWDESALERMD